MGEFEILLKNLLGDKIVNEKVILNLYVEVVDDDLIPCLHAITLDNFIKVLFGEFDEDLQFTGVLNLPQEATYQTLVMGDPDGTKGLLQFIEQWHNDGLI